jgi:hypothetical protein
MSLMDPLSNRLCEGHEANTALQAAPHPPHPLSLSPPPRRVTTTSKHAPHSLQPTCYYGAAWPPAGNHCDGGERGRERGYGQMVVTKPGPGRHEGDECGWDVVKIIDIPPRAYFMDYSGMAFKGDRVRACLCVTCALCLCTACTLCPCLLPAL